MSLNGILLRQLNRLRCLKGQHSLLQSVEKSHPVSSTLREFEKSLIEAIDKNSISDNSILQAADCLYDLNKCNSSIGSQICKIVESRPEIYTRPLHGGVLWSFHIAAGFNIKRKKAVKSSCNASLVAFLDYLLTLQANDKVADELGSKLRNLAIVGRCFKLPSSTLTRLEQGIIDATGTLSRALDSSPLIVNYLVALQSLKVKSETIAELAISWFLAAACHHEIMSINCLTRAIRTLDSWTVKSAGVPHSAVGILNRLLVTSPPQLLLKNSSALVKLYVAASRIPVAITESPSSDYTEETGTVSASRVEPVDKTGQAKATMGDFPAVIGLSITVLKYCCDIVHRFNSHNLLLLLNSLSQTILRDEKSCNYGSGELRKYVHIVTREMVQALDLDSSAIVNGDSLPYRPYDQKDLMTIIRSGMIVTRVGEELSDEVVNIAKQLLSTRYGTQHPEGQQGSGARLTNHMAQNLCHILPDSSLQLRNLVPVDVKLKLDCGFRHVSP